MHSIQTKTLFCISIAVLFSGCSLIHYFSVSEMKSESMAQVNEYLIRLSIDTNHAYQILPGCIDSLSFSKYQIDTYKLEHGTKASPVQLRMYDNKGNFIYGWTQCFGSIERLGLLDSLPLKQLRHLPVNKSLSFSNDINLFNINDLEKKNIKESIENYDYVLIAFWAEWTGWYSKNLLINLIKYIKRHKEHKILLLTLNTSP